MPHWIVCLGVLVVCACSSPVEATPAVTLRSSIEQQQRAFVSAPLPEINNASASYPLIFFHQAKASGSGVRHALFRVAENTGLAAYIPCHGSVPCLVTHLPPAATFVDSRPAVIAGHFGFGETANLPRAYAVADRFVGKRWSQPPAHANFSCFTVFRDPVARLESCYYYRFVYELGIGSISPRHACLSSLSAIEITDLFHSMRTQWGSGCLNEPFRIFSGISDEEWLAHIDGTRSFQVILARTLKNLAKCVPVVLEDARSLQVLQRWLPQFAPELAKHLSKPETSRALPEGSDPRRPVRCPLSDGARHTLSQLARHEAIVYDAAKQRLEAFMSQVEE
jgi:hypothetical protein